MKKIFILLTSICVSTLSLAQQPLTTRQQEVQQTVINFFEALSNRDSVSLINQCTAGIILLENGKIWNADSLLLKAITLNTATDFKRVNNIDFIQTTVSQQTAWTSYNLHSSITKNGQQLNVHWMETVVAIKEQKKWKIKLLHSTLVKRG